MQNVLNVIFIDSKIKQMKITYKDNNYTSKRKYKNELLKKIDIHHKLDTCHLIAIGSKT